MHRGLWFYLSLCLVFGSVSHAGALFYDLDIHPAFERIYNRLSKDEEVKKKKSVGTVLAIYMDVALSSKLKGLTLANVMAMSFKLWGIELYAVDKYGLYDEYRCYLLSPRFDLAAKKLDRLKKMEPKMDLRKKLDLTCDILQKAMVSVSPEFKGFYESAYYLEAQGRMLYHSTHSPDRLSRAQCDSELLTMALVMNRRCQEISTRQKIHRLPRVLREMEDDMKAYYRLYGEKCSGEVQEACRRHVELLKEAADMMEARPRDVSPEVALGVVLVWTAAGRNPLEPAILDTAGKLDWTSRMKRSFENLSGSFARLKELGKRYM